MNCPVCGADMRPHCLRVGCSIWLCEACPLSWDAERGRAFAVREERV